MKTLIYVTDRAILQGPSDNAGRAGLLHERAVLSARLANLLRRSLRGLDWAGLAAADRDGLERGLTALGGDIPLVWWIRGQAAAKTQGTAHGPDTAKNKETAKKGETAKAAPAASPSRSGIESSDGEAAFPGHPAPADVP